MEACQEAELPLPEFQERSGGFVVTLNKTLGNELGNRLGNFGMISERVRNDFGSSVAKVFEIICQHPDYSAKDIATELGKTPRTVENYIAKLKQGDIIMRKGPKLGGHWEVIDE
jgi:predicted HTH transcriptional regulator